MTGGRKPLRRLARQRVAAKENFKLNSMHPFFAKLPGEIRNEIYKYVLGEGEQHAISQTDGGGWKVSNGRFEGTTFPMPGALQVCKQMRSETLCTLFKGNRFLINMRGPIGEFKKYDYLTAEPLRTCNYFHDLDDDMPLLFKFPPTILQHLRFATITFTATERRWNPYVLRAACIELDIMNDKVTIRGGIGPNMKLRQEAMLAKAIPLQLERSETYHNFRRGQGLQQPLWRTYLCMSQLGSDIEEKMGARKVEVEEGGPPAAKESVSAFEFEMPPRLRVLALWELMRSIKKLRVDD